MRVTLKDGLDMCYEVHGEGEPFVLINGLKSDRAGWMPLLEDLKKRFQVVLFDNRAVGQTRDDGRPFSIEDMASDAIQLMDHLKIESAYVAGHSMGGAITQVITHRYPERVKKAFLCNTFIKFSPASQAAFGEVVHLYKSGASRADIMNVVIPLVFDPSLDTPEFRSQIHAFVAGDPSWQSQEDYERQLVALNAFDSTGWVGEISVPTVVVGSKADVTATLAESVDLAAKIPGAALEILEGGHASAVEQPAAFSAILFKHLNASCAPTMRAQ